MRIVVGVSETAGSHPAIDWALPFAKDNGAAVEFVHVVDTTWGHAPQDYIETALLEAEERLRDREDAARAQFPDLTIEAHVRFGSPVNELTAAAGDADYLVLGAHPGERYDGASRLAVRVTRLAACSVIVAPSSVVPVGAGVVVGVDGSDESDLAVAFAAELAHRHGEPLTVIHAWNQPEAWAAAEPLLMVPDPEEEDRLVIDQALAGLSDKYPGLTVTSGVTAARAERALYAAAIGARMLVVGSSGRHGLARALMGSVSEAVVADLPCPVAVIRARRS
jgi:nucleotide-binding universal stress UspA family protein